MSDIDFQSFLPDLIEIRHQLHQIPEIGLSELKTSNFIAAQLEKWGFEITRGLGKTGIVATLRAGNGNRAIGFRADFDALPMQEETNLPYASQHPGAMHACGHDGHTSMLLGAAWALSKDKSFSGTVHFIFQPAEENFGGGKLMMEDGLFERFPCDEIFALHNWPGISAGTFTTRAGPIAASIDVVTVTVKGKGGHGAQPELTVDPVVVGSSIVMALQTLTSRNISPHQPAVVTVGAFLSGSASNIIPDTAVLEISMRAMNPNVREEIRERVEQVATLQAKSYGADISFDWQVGYPATINDKDAVEAAKSTIIQHFGQGAFVGLDLPLMGSEDFSFLLEKVPGAYVLIGNGDSAGLHTTTYDFNDDILQRGAMYFYHLAKGRLS
ncbi:MULTISPECIES: M20 aminoacylase family protein [unclassified Rhizobium]|jgi:hippurate hydrolase|uniref:M20 aminoacylase family protein n=1 Tax=unclassified Rhizobium TaxID=2613769 RepID=UPI000646E86D|nr:MULTISPECIES: M20 aminoacylase family protein [unclassified Rhizobium]MBN8952461.1 amidohydrolase [Rhizobium tropici]OJY78941.1 MAG: amidohydrolase [Rhizobium sp. 60-20]RKD67662.1 hippurate hydrolase [Rhizobium sp. WW_1]